MPRRQFVYSRRTKWSKDEWIIAYDACPKDAQRYGPEADFVREVADLINRTPAAVSRAFGNLWAAQTGGRRGLKHFARMAAEVVDQYRHKLPELHQEALRLRRERIPTSLTPRLEVVSHGIAPAITEEEIRSAARKVGLRQEQYFVTTRRGSFVLDVGFLLQVLLLGAAAWQGIIQTIQFIEQRRASHRDSAPQLEVVTKSTTWSDVESGRQTRVEERVIRFHLPGFPAEQLQPDQKSRLAGFLSFIRGVARKPAPRQKTLAETVPRARSAGRPYTRRGLERLLGVDLSEVPDSSIRPLSDIVKVAKTAGFGEALRAERRRAKGRARR